MEIIFLKLLNRSIAAGWLILAVLVLRFLFRKAPGWFFCALWGIVALRLLCPFSPVSPLSLLPSGETLSPYTVQFSTEPEIQSGVPVLDHTLNPIIQDTFTPSPGASVNPLYVWTFFAAVLWGIGAFCLLAHGLAALIRIRSRIRESVPFRDNLRLCDSINAPFILGILHPRIYLPADTDQAQLPYILAHEQAHLKRLDHWWKPLAYLLLSVYWFHPLIWVAYHLFCRDLELACDEKVIRDLSLEEKKAYSHALVSCSLQQRLVLTCPLAFGEISVKKRVNRILHYQKPALWLLAAAAAAGIITAVCFLTDPPEHISQDRAAIPTNEKETLPDTTGIHSSADTMPLPSAGSGQRDAEMFPNSGQNPMELPGSQPHHEDLPDASDAQTPHGTAEPLTDDTDPAVASLLQAASAAILEHNASSGPETYDLACCDFTILGTKSQSLASESSEQTFTSYGWALYQTYHISETGIEDVGGSHIPVALTFEIKEDSYSLKDYWEPRDGSYFAEDIRNRFPEFLTADGMDSQKFILPQIQSCYRQAVEYSGLDTDAVIRRLLKTICSDPAVSSAPRDYIQAHALEYRELTYYGSYTLSYCFRRFQKGGETGLEGWIMALVCEDLLGTREILPANTDTAQTGQLWYDTLYAHASNQVEMYLQ